MDKDRNMRGIRRLQTVQLTFILFVSLVVLMVSGKQSAISALSGGLVAFLPSLLFAKKMFAYSGARAARQIVMSFYLAEALKIASSLILFVLVFIFYKVSPLVFFLTYITVVMTHWLAPLIIDNQRNRQVK